MFLAIFQITFLPALCIFMPVLCIKFFVLSPFPFELVGLDSKHFCFSYPSETHFRNLVDQNITIFNFLSKSFWNYVFDLLLANINSQKRCYQYFIRLWPAKFYFKNFLRISKPCEKNCDRISF